MEIIAVKFGVLNGLRTFIRIFFSCKITFARSRWVGWPGTLTWRNNTIVVRGANLLQNCVTPEISFNCFLSWVQQYDLMYSLGVTTRTLSYEILRAHGTYPRCSERKGHCFATFQKYQLFFVFIGIKSVCFPLTLVQKLGLPSKQLIMQASYVVKIKSIFSNKEINCILIIATRISLTLLSIDI